MNTNDFSCQVSGVSQLKTTFDSKEQKVIFESFLVDITHELKFVRIFEWRLRHD
jgi:hypothetical protein